MWRHKFLILLYPCTQLSNETIARTVKFPGTMDFVSLDIFPVAFPSGVFPLAMNFSLPSHFSSGRRKKKLIKPNVWGPFELPDIKANPGAAARTPGEDGSPAEPSAPARPPRWPEERGLWAGL